MHIILVGSPGNGFTAVGPLATSVVNIVDLDAVMRSEFAAPLSSSSLGN